MEKIVQLNNNYQKLENYDIEVDPAYWYDIKLKIDGYNVERIILFDNTYEESFSSKVIDGIARFNRMKFNRFSYLDLIAITEDNRNAFTMCNFLYVDVGIHRLMAPTIMNIEYNKVDNGI